MINEELLGAYLEGNLSENEAAYVESQLAADPDLQDLADDAYAYVDEDAPYALDLDDIDLPAIETEPVELVYAEVDADEDQDTYDWETDDDPQTDDSADDFDFIDDPCADL